jgi:molybdopterin-guanine dinucleotide biosynthesis protein A
MLPETIRSLLTGVVLAGGRAQRMGGRDKGLLSLAGVPMVEHVLKTLEPQVGCILINANRHQDRYAVYGYPVVPDILEGFYGPLAGMASAMRAVATPYIITVPCDSPFVPPDLARRLYEALVANRAELSAAHDGERLQPVFSLLCCSLQEDLMNYLQGGGRKIETWYDQHRLAIADFSDRKDAFININTPEEIQAVESRLKHQSQ